MTLPIFGKGSVSQPSAAACFQLGLLVEEQKWNDV
jgi:hypothetical protein